MSDRLDAGNAQCLSENRSPHFKICILAAGKANIPPTESFAEDVYFAVLNPNRIMRLLLALTLNCLLYTSPSPRDS